MSLTALEWGLRAPITPRFGGNLEALPRLQETEPKQQKKPTSNTKLRTDPQGGLPLIEPDVRIARIRLSECRSSVCFMRFAIWCAWGS